MSLVSDDSKLAWVFREIRVRMNERNNGDVLLHLLHDLPEWKVTSGTCRCSNVSVADDSRCRDLMSFGDVFDEFCDSVQLSPTGTRLFEVSNETNSDAAIVVLKATRVSAVELLLPAKCG